MPIPPPKASSDYKDRRLDCQHALELVLAQILDDAARSGWRQPECFDAVEALIADFRQSYEEDPDPADDPIHVLEGITESPYS